MFIRMLPALAVASTLAAAILGNIRGVVHDPSHRPVAGAQVTIQALHAAWTRGAVTDRSGEFQLTGVPAGEYTVTVTADGFDAAAQTVAVSSGSAPVLHFPLQVAAAHQSVEVTEQAGEVQAESAETVALIPHSAIVRTPGADRANSLALITSEVPGAYVVHDQLHIRGGHQVTWAVDGIPLPNTNIASNVGPQFDPKDMDYLEVRRGALGAEYGDRSYAVLNVVPRTGFERNNEGELSLGYGSFYQADAQLSFGSHTEKFAYYASVNGNRSDFGLATPGPDILHDRSAAAGGFGTLVYNSSPNDQWRLVTALRQDDYQVPNDPAQQAAGTRDQERENDAFADLSWVHALARQALLTVSPFYHFNRAHYAGSAEDNRASRYAGAQILLAGVTAHHNARAGLYGFQQSDESLFGVGSLRQREMPSGHLEALFLEDQWRAVSWLNLNAGLRLTHFSGALAENAADPRLGAAVTLPRLHWVLRAAYARYYQAPPLDSISGPLLGFAAGQGFGFLPLHGERDRHREFGLTVPLRGWSVELTQFHTEARNYFDHNALGNSNIFLPVTIAAARIRGTEVTLRSPRLLRRGEAHLVYSHQRAEGAGALTGGLTDFAPPEGRFLLDHDQAHTLSAGFSLDLPARCWASGSVAYGSGFADNGGPAHLPGHTTADFALGTHFGERWDLSASVLNTANRRFLLDNSETFGGTHYADPRQFLVRLTYRFHY